MYNTKCSHSRDRAATSATPKMELFVTIVNGFWLLTIFVKLSILDVCGSPICPGYAPMCWQYATKISILEDFSDPRLAYVTDAMIPFSNGYSPYKSLASATNALVCISKIPKHMVTWSKNSILVVTVAPDSAPFKFAWGEGLKKISPSDLSKSSRLAED